MEKRVEVLAVRPNQPAVMEEIENTLEAQQRLVGGYIEVLDLEDKCYLICNEDGISLELRPNRVVEPYGMIVGTFFITRIIADSGYLAPLTKAQREKYLKLFQ